MQLPRQLVYVYSWKLGQAIVGLGGEVYAVSRVGQPFLPLGQALG
ncbi:MAG: hypothetical protein ACPGR8_02035 [Limisphaerales bacterium]